MLCLEDKPVFDAFYEKYPPVHSDYVFSTMMSWMEYSKYHYAFLGENLVILTKIHDRVRFRLHPGAKNKDVVQQVLRLAYEQGSDEPFGVVDTHLKSWMQSLYPGLQFLKHRDFFDYVYCADDLAELQGTAYRKIRNRLNKFQKNHRYRLELISEDILDEVQTFLKRWCLWKDCESDEILSHEKNAILYSMNHFVDLGLSGLVLRINDEIEALSVYEQMNADTVIVHYEKGSPYFDGIYKAINMETAKQVQHDVTYINREEDMGIAGLRKAKMSYRPHHMVEVFHVDKKNIGKVLHEQEE